MIIPLRMFDDNKNMPGQAAPIGFSAGYPAKPLLTHVRIHDTLGIGSATAATNPADRSFLEDFYDPQ